VGFIVIEEKRISGKTYCLGSGEGKPLREYVEVVGNIINVEYQPDYGEIQYLCANIAKLTADTGWMPEISFEEGTKKTFISSPYPCTRFSRFESIYYSNRAA
jgi:nucleoside-diphosphate-sugar epimerase